MVKNQSIILFDGVCNLCNTAVQFVIKHDAEQKFLFASLQSEAGQKLMEQNNIITSELSSLILIQNNKIFTKSTGALKVAAQLKGAIKLLYVFIIVPAFIRNGVYNFIARNRYKWFGKQLFCMIPTPELRARFLN